MIIEAQKIVAIQLEIADLEGSEVLASEAERPLVYMHGNGTLVPGLERALAGRAPGDAIDVTLQPTEAFGEVDPQKIQYVPRSQFPPNAELEVGMQFGAQDPQGRTVVLWITEIEDDRVTVNANHPLAGHVLRFKAKVVAIRESNDAERQAGRPLGKDASEGPPP